MRSEEVSSMVVFLVAMLFAAFVTVDLIQERRRRRELAHVGASLHARVHEGQPHFVAGFDLPEGLHYHRGHAWVHWVAPDQAYVGMDDFARRLVGAEASLELPRVGAWTDQGRVAVSIRRQGEEAELMAPISGEVIAVNPDLRGDASTAFGDCYGRGWLYKIRAPHLFDQLSNLLDGSLATKWMEDTRDRFQHQLVLATGSVIQDGGVMVEDLAEHLDGEQWSALTHTFLSTGSPRS